jgi:hypothetical protein
MVGLAAPWMDVTTPRSSHHHIGVTPATGLSGTEGECAGLGCRLARAATTRSCTPRCLLFPPRRWAAVGAAPRDEGRDARLTLAMFVGVFSSIAEQIIKSV